MSNSTDGARPHAADATVNTATPATNERRRPTRSVSRPQRISEAINTPRSTALSWATPSWPLARYRAPPALSVTTVSASRNRGGRSTNTSAMPAARSRMQVGAVGDRGGERSARRRRARRTPRRARARARAPRRRSPTSVSTPRARATSSTPRCTAPKNGFDDVLEDQPDARRLAVGPPQRARGEVVAVAEQLDRVAHAHREVGPHAVAAVDHARDRAEAHAGDRRDLAHRRAARRAPLRVLHPHERPTLQLQENDLKA